MDYKKMKAIQDSATGGEKPTIDQIADAWENVKDKVGSWFANDSETTLPKQKKKPVIGEEMLRKQALEGLVGLPAKNIPSQEISGFDAGTPSPQFDVLNPDELRMIKHYHSMANDETLSPEMRTKFQNKLQEYAKDLAAKKSDAAERYFKPEYIKGE